MYDGDKIKPDESYKHYTEVLRLKSDSTWGVTCKEVANIGLSSRSDPKEDFESHSVIVFDDSGSRSHAKKLRKFASARSCIYRP